MGQKEIRKVLLMPWGKDQNNNYYPRQKVDFPRVTNIFIEFDTEKLVGKAKNFKNTPKGIICDVTMFDWPNALNTIAPVLVIENVITKNSFKHCKGLTVRELGLIKNHSFEKSNGNLRRKVK